MDAARVLVAGGGAVGRGVAKRQVQNSPPVLLELRRTIGPNGVVTAIVWARCHFVDQYVALFIQKQFNGQ